MISRIRGKALAWHEATQSVEIDVGVESGGLVYEVRLPTAVWLGYEDERPDALNLVTHYYVPERGAPVPVLIGFRGPVERDFFRKLIGVPQMGVAKALQALAEPIATIAQAIEAEDRRALMRLPGIGARQADRIIADLKGKVTVEAALDDGLGAAPTRVGQDNDEIIADALEALLGLGYTRRDAERWLGAVLDQTERDASLSTEDLLRAVLEQIGANP